MSLFLSFFSRALSKSLSLTDDFSFSSAPLSFTMSLQSSFVFLFTRIIGVKPEALQIINGRADEDMKFCGHIVSLFPNVVAGFGSLVPASIPDRYFRPRRFPVTISFGGTISRFTRFAVNTPTSRIAETKTSLTSILPPESLSVEISARCALTREELRFVEIQPWHRQCRGSGTVALP